MIKRILKWTGIIVGSIIILLTITVSLRQDLKFAAPFPEIKASTDSGVIARGKYLALGPAHCADCHASPDSKELVEKGIEVPLSGGYKFDLPIGAVYVKNITSDTLTGIGKYTDAEISRILRFGVRPDGTAVLPFMPFHNTSDEDLTAIISFLRTQQPVRNKVPENTTTVVGSIVKAFLLQ